MPHSSQPRGVRDSGAPDAVQVPAEAAGCSGLPSPADPTGRTVHLLDAGGTVRDWLVSPAWSVPCDDLAEFVESDGEPWGERGRWVLTNGPDVSELKEALARAHPLEPVPPSPAGANEEFVWRALGDERRAVWRRARTGWDGLLDWSEFCFTPEYRTAIAAVTIFADQAEWRTFEVSATGPFVLWLNGAPILSGGRVSYMEPEVSDVRIRVPSGPSHIHLATWQVAFRECRHVARLRIRGLPVQVVIPERGADEWAARWADTVLDRVGSPSWALDSCEGIVTAPGEVALRVRVDGGAEQRVTADADGIARYRLDRIEDPDPVSAPRIPGERSETTGGPPVDGGRGPSSGRSGSREDGTSGPLAMPLVGATRTVHVRVDDSRCPQVRRFSVALLPQDVATKSAGTPEAWRRDVLTHLATTLDPRAQRPDTATLLARHALRPVSRAADPPPVIPRGVAESRPVRGEGERHVPVIPRGVAESAVEPTGSRDRAPYVPRGMTEAPPSALSGGTANAGSGSGSVDAEPAMVDAGALENALHRIGTRGDCADFEVLGLVLLLHTVPAGQWEPGARAAVEHSLTGMKYWITQPGLDAMCYFTENHQFVWHVAQALAGQLHAGHVFGVDGRTGAEHAREGRARAAAWISRKLAGGFSEFDSNAYLAIDTYALVALIEVCDDPGLRQAAAVLLDKTLVTLACNSWRGVHGAAHGRSYVPTLRSSRFEETSPVLRLIGGVGALNHNRLPAAALATSSRYEIPDVVRALVAEPAREWWGRQVYRGDLAFERDLLSRPYRSDVRVWRTPHAMLSSVQDYRSGLPGLQEHVWGATLGPEAQVFVTHPANADTSGSARPNAWSGHRILPRVHQHRHALIHVHRFTPSDPVRRTHLWFPVAQFDEWYADGEWLCGRRGDGYVAVATPGGLAMVTAGEAARQEWRPEREGAVWLAVVGSSAEGTFSDWSARQRAARLRWFPAGSSDPGVEWHVPRGPLLELTYDGPFLVNGVPDGMHDGVPEPEPHLDNPAVRCEFGQESATVGWGGVTHDLAIGAALRAAQEVMDRNGG